MKVDFILSVIQVKPGLYIRHTENICACARKASMNMRIDAQGRRVKEGEQVVIGGNERYRAVCPSCFYSDDSDAERAPGLFS